MFNKYLYIYIVIFTTASCTQNKKEEKRQNPFAPKVVEAKGYIVPQDSMIEPEVIIIDESKLKRVAAGKPTIVPINTNIHPAGTPKMVLAGTPSVCIPGQDTFLLPKKILAIDSPFVAGIPDIVVAKDAQLRDRNSGNFSTFNRMQGLLGDVVMKMLEDKNGNLWFATWGGISKYDGKYFTQYTVKEGLIDKNIIDILEDKDGNIWIGTLKGVSKYNGRTFVNYTEKSGLVNEIITGLIQDQEGNIWISTSGGVSKYDGKFFTNYTEKEGLHNDISRMALAHNGDIWFATNGDGIVKYDAVGKLKTGKESFIHYTVKEGLSNDTVQCIMEDNDKNLWFATDQGVSKFDGKYISTYTEEQGLPHNAVYGMFHDNDKCMWFCTNKGVAKYDGKSFTYYTEKEGLSNNSTSSVYNDKKGNMWFTTQFGGVSKYDGKIFEHYLEKEEQLTSDYIKCIYKDRKNNIWIAIDKSGLLQYEILPHSNPKKKYINCYSQAQGLSDNWISTILEDRNGDMWFGSLVGGISKLNASAKDHKGKETFTYFSQKDGFGNGKIKQIIEDKKGNICIIFRNGGLYKYDGNIIDAITRGETAPNNRNLKKVNGHYVKTLTHYKTKGFSFMSIFEDTKENLWLATFGGGVLKYNPNNDSKSFTQFTQNSGLSSNNISMIMEDKSGIIWIGTNGGGVCRYDGKYFTHFTQKQGLTDNYVYSILEDKKGNLWFATKTGISKLSKKLSASYNSYDSYLEKINSLKDDDIIFKNYKYEDGLLFSFESHSNMCEDANGTIWVGTNKRLIAFHPEELLEDSIAPNTQLMNLKLYNEDIPWSTIQNKKDSTLILGNGMQVSNFEFDGVAKWYNIPQNLSLSYNNNYLTFNFIGIIQKQNKKVKYKYFLEGNDVNWSAVTSKNEATYGNLAPGIYTFKVKAMNGEGYWSTENSYTFTIRPPWWKTWWAYLLYIISGLSILYIIYYLRTSTLRKTQILLEKKVEERTQELIKTQGQLIQSEKLAAFGAVATRVAHEIQNPINFVNNFSNLSEELVNEIMESDNEEDKKESAKLLIDNLQKINHHGKRADKIVKQLFEHTKAGTAHEYFDESEK